MAKALVSLKVYDRDWERVIKKFLKSFMLETKIIVVSSIYKVKGQEFDAKHVHDLTRTASFEALCLAVKCETNLTALELLSQLTQAEKHIRKEVHHRNLSLNLLAYENQVVMTPGLTLPYPEWRHRPEEIVPAAEVWGDYSHPVLGEALKDLAKVYKNEKWGEFVTQGKSLLDL